MVSIILLEPNGVYDDGSLHLALEIPSATLVRARREGRLRYARKGRRILYLGKWILDWLEADTDRRESAHAQ
jgi:hypothetical protein